MRKYPWKFEEIFQRRTFSHRYTSNNRSPNFAPKNWRPVFQTQHTQKLGKSFQELIKLTAILNIFLSLSNHLTLKLGLKFMPALFHSSLSYHLCIKPIHTWSIKIQFVLTIFEALSLKQTNCLEARWVHFCLSSYKTQIEMCNNTQYKIWNSIVSNDQKCLK